MKNETLLLVFDAGTGSGRCLIFDSQGKLIAGQARTWPYQTGAEGQISFDPREWWAILLNLCREAMRGIEPTRIGAISATSQRQGFVGFDQAGHEILGWPNLDRSTTSNLTERVAESLYNEVGRWPGPIHVAPRLAAKPSIATFLPLSDWILYRLSGVKATEPSQAAESCLFSVELKDWSASAVQAFGLAKHTLPPLQNVGTIRGELKESVAPDLGLPPGLPIITGGADTQCGTLGCGIVRPGEIGLIAGTSAPLQLCLDWPVFDPEHRTITGPYLLAERWMLESNAMFTGLSYARLCNLVAPGRDLGELNRLMAIAEAEFTGLPFYIGSSIMDSRHGSLLPWGAMFFPLPFGDYEPLTLLRAALESAAFAVRANLAQLERVSGRNLPSEEPLVIGGGASQGFWPQLIADSCKRKVYVAVQPEVSGLGAAMCAATGIGLFADLETAAQAMARTGRQLEPRPIKNIDQFYQRWLATYQNLAKLTLPE